MKIYYNRYTEMSCFTIRGRVGMPEWKMLQLGFDLLFKELEGMLIFNLVHAELQPDVLLLMMEYKKTIPKFTKQKVFIISKERGLGDFPKVELFLSRFQGSKMRQIGDKIILEDQIYGLELETQAIEAQIQALGFDETSSRKEIQKNNMQKTQKKSLDGCLKWQRLRKAQMQKVPCDIEDLEMKLKSNLEEITKSLGKPIDL